MNLAIVQGSQRIGRQFGGWGEAELIEVHESPVEQTFFVCKTASLMQSRPAAHEPTVAHTVRMIGEAYGYSRYPSFMPRLTGL